MKGLSLARSIAMISYRSPVSFDLKFKGETTFHSLKTWINDFNHEGNKFQVQSYLEYQGEKLVERIDANTYLCLSKALDLHDISNNRGKMSEILSQIKANTLCIGISSDFLYPPQEQQDIAKFIPDAQYREIVSDHGHDAFLIEFDQLKQMIGEFINDINK